MHYMFFEKVLDGFTSKVNIDSDSSRHSVRCGDGKDENMDQYFDRRLTKMKQIKTVK